MVMDKKITIGIFMLLLASGFIFLSYDKDDADVKLMSEDDYEEIDYKIDTGITPKQTWQIIHGEDVGEVLNLKSNKK